MFLAHLCKLAALQEALKNCRLGQILSFWIRGMPGGKKREKGLLRLHGNPKKKTDYFVLLRDATVRQGLSTEFPVLM